MTKLHVTSMVFLAVCACGGGGDSDGDPDGGNNGGGDGTSSPTETRAGYFTISSSRYTVSSTPVETGYASGTMYRIPPSTSGGGGGCSSAMYGACDVQTCTAVATPTDGGLAITYTDSGTIAISGVQVNNGTMTLTPGGGYSYTTVSGAVALFNGGATVRWVAPGNASGGPGFDVSLVAPTAVQVTAPSFVQGKVAASAAQDLSVAWSGSPTSPVTAQLAAGVSGHSVVARCTFNGSSGVVPAAAVSAVASAGGTASIIVMMENRSTKTPDGWNLNFSLQTYGLIPSGIAAGTLELH